MDIRSLDIVAASTHGFEYEVINPVTNKGMGIKITVIGAMNPAYKDDMQVFDGEIEDYKDSLKLDEAKTKKAKAELLNKLKKFDDQKTAEFLAKYTKSWSGMVEDGKPVEFSIENATRVYLEYPIIAGQVKRAMTTLANFIKA